jgi:predicted RNA-binding Zn-ribbon protein involved in translation (DUF1610 family)
MTTPDHLLPREARYCANCGADLSHPALSHICPDCGRRFCLEVCRAEHTELGVCPGVEPPADVQATPDPRLDVVADHVAMGGPWLVVAQRILDALDAMQSATVPHTIDVCRRAVADWDATHAVFSAEWRDPAPDSLPLPVCAEHFPGRPWLTCRTGLPTSHDGPCDWTPRPAPAGLSAAQVKPWIEFGSKLATNAIAAVAVVEHGPDETPALLALGRRHQHLRDDLNAMTARADLAEARLGQIRAASHDGIGDAMFRSAVLYALAWTPDDTAPADATTGDGDGQV